MTHADASATSFAAARSTLAAARRAGNAREVASALAAFTPLTDPRRFASELGDGAPFALLPVRLETRFIRVSAGDASRPQLWVRIYPDDCWIDTFEPMLAAAELVNAKLYWQRIWQAGGIEADQRAAWSGLVAAHGSGRAGYIVDTYAPVNAAAAPVKANATDVILVIPTMRPLDPAEAAAISAYWQAIWLADGDSAQSQAAADALQAAVGNARASTLVRDYQPFNLGDVPAKPLLKSGVGVSTAFVVLPPDPATKSATWTQAPRVDVFPERFVILGYNGGELTLQAIGNVISLPLYVGPDPSVDLQANPDAAIHPQGDDLFVPDPLKWMTDFPQAVAAGMGIAIDLTAEQARAGFDRLLAIGIVLSATSSDAASALTYLFRHHAQGRSGLAIVPQGAPAHNSTGVESGHTAFDDPDQSFNDRKARPLFTPTTDPNQKRDGQWLAEVLGIDPALAATLQGGDGVDQMEGRAMRRAMWPATIGYWMDKLLAPVFSDDTVASTRAYFIDHVSGRGLAPAIHIGKQPYGVLPTTAFSRVAWLNPDARRSELTYLARLRGVLQRLDVDWTAMSGSAAFVGKPGDAHQLLLDIVGLHPSSVEYYSRTAESLDELFNVANIWGLGPDLFSALLALALNAAAGSLLQAYGYTGAQQPDILNHYFFKPAEQVTSVIDDRPLSEADPIRTYATGGRNYIQWLIDAAQSSLDALNGEADFIGGASPQTLLYLYLRHALLLGYYDTSYFLHKSAGFLSAAQLAAMKPEPVFVHVAAAAPASESRFAALVKTEPRITGSATLLVSDYISRNLVFLPQSAGLKDQIDALGILANAPTARLERSFAETIDLCSYRYDAWLLGLVDYQLRAMRAANRDNGDRGQDGAYLGAFAWLEDLRPSNAELHPAQLPAQVADGLKGDGPILQDPSNGGYIHAPSMTHARTAAVLRSGYLANATAANPQTLSVNLSSDRVRLALSVLDGVRAGQSVGALLGYRFERGLHDDHGLAEVDKFIYPLRKAFPLVADNLAPTQTPSGVPIEAIEARNVMDGRKLVDQMKMTGNAAYPFGASGLPAATAPEATAINAEANALLDVYDAIADLALSEGVHQAVQGNFDRIGATLNAYTSGNFPPDPQVVQTGPTGIALTHRVAVQFTPGRAAAAGATPRGVAEPALDAWVGGVLPPLDQIGCVVTWTDAAGVAQSFPVTLADLALRPLDVLALAKPDAGQTMTELDDRILGAAYQGAGPRPDAALTIGYMTAPAGKLSIFEAMALIRALRMLIAGARPLRATDVMLHNSATLADDAAVFADAARIKTPKAQLDALGADIDAYLAPLQALLTDPNANSAAILAGIDGFLDGAVALLERAARFNVPLSGWGFAYAWRQGAVADLIAQVDGLLTRWNGRLADFDAKVAAYDALPAGTSDDDRFRALRAAEADIMTAIGARPPSPATLRATLNAERAAFVARRDQFNTTKGMASPAFLPILNAVAALLPVAQFDATPFDLSPFTDRAVVLATDLAANLTSRRKAIASRSAAVQAQLDAHDASAVPAVQVAALQAAAKVLLGDDFVLVPEFSLGATQAGEWGNAFAASTGGALLSWLRTTANIEFPVEEWMSGAARVRPMLHAWESIVALSAALGRPELSLTPIQLPFEATAPWLALQFRPDYTIASDRLLYTAYYTTPFDGTVRQCGLLFDEWSEVIPLTNRDTGITFNFRRPDNEPPQTILVVTPASANGRWQWDDLVAALHETLDLAKKRAVEPTQLDNTPYAPLLPATTMAVTLYAISIGTSLSVANGALRDLGAAYHV
jgi:hypothetical protein